MFFLSARSWPTVVVCYRMTPRKLFVFTNGVFILGVVTNVIHQL